MEYPLQLSVLPTREATPLCARLNPHQSHPPQSPSEARYRHGVARPEEISHGHIVHQMQTWKKSGEPRSHPSRGRSRDALWAGCGEAGLLSKQLLTCLWLPEKSGENRCCFLLCAAHRAPGASLAGSDVRTTSRSPSAHRFSLASTFDKRALGCQTVGVRGQG